MRAQPLKRSKQRPTYEEEASLFEQGYSLVAGLDEVGRGPLAGPVAAGVAVLPSNLEGQWVGLIRDSKQMTPVQRERALPFIQDAALALGVGMSTSQEIDDLGIVQATRLAMARALDSLPLLPQYLLLDAFPLPGVAIPQKAIIRGDALCLSIAAASIVAKVTRDRLMVEQDVMFPGYGFARHKGYGTKEHIRSLMRLGPCAIHRRSFAPIKHLVSSSR
jgi:ribonuclease HII